MIPTPLLPLRNGLAEIILKALGDAGARRELARLGAGSPDDRGRAPGWLDDADSEQVALVRERARRAGAAIGPSPLLPATASRDEALAAAAMLFDAGLHFEVHELLEPYWARAQGRERQALQGLIQIAVGYQHLANGNLAGARALLDEGPRRLRDGELPGLDLSSFAADIARTAGRLGAGGAPAAPAFPRIGTGRETKWISS